MVKDVAVCHAYQGGDWHIWLSQVLMKETLEGKQDEVNILCLKEICSCNARKLSNTFNL